MMRPSLLAQPHANYVSHILRSFEGGKPLSCDQLNFLATHEKILSTHGLDSVIKYYLKSYHDKQKADLSFRFPKQKINQVTTRQIKQTIQTLLKSKLDHVDLKMTLEQFAQFKYVGINELIFWHGNQFLTGAPFQPGGIPYIIYFQWGNLFGVVKFQILPEEKALKGNVLIYFEDMSNRNLYECVKEYEHKLKDEFTHIDELEEQNRVEETLIQHKTPTMMFKPIFFDIDSEE